MAPFAQHAWSTDVATFPNSDPIPETRREEEDPGQEEETEEEDDIDDEPARDLSWVPSFASYRARCLRRLKRTTAAAATSSRAKCSSSLPLGYPPKLDSRFVWSGSNLTEEEYIVHLNDADLREVQRALKYFQGLNQPVSSITATTFPLPHLGQRLLTVRSELYHGRGFFVLRGLEPRNFTDEENVIIYVGVSSYIAPKRGRQDEHNNHLLHLIDLGAEVAPDELRQAPYSSVEQPFHTDTGEILALYALGTAHKGGKSKLASSWKIYNELAALRPDYINLLKACNWPFDSFGQSPSYYKRPLLSYREGRPILTFSRRPLTGSSVSPRTRGIPSLTEAQAEVLDAVHFAAERHCLKIDCRRGDMQFWNNLALLHGREGFQDKPPEAKRHLLRLWLKNDDESWPLPDFLKEAWENAYGPGDGQPEQWPVVPQKDYDHVTTRRRSSGHA